MRIAAVVVALVWLSMAVSADDAVSGTRFEIRNSSDIVLRVWVNESGPFRFLLDTASTRSAVSADIARRLGIQVVSPTEVVTPTGASTRSLVRLQQLGIEGGPTVAALALVAKPADLPTGVDGLIGQDLLRTATYTIDYPQQRITWRDRNDRTKWDETLGLEWARGRLVVSVPGGIGPTTLRLIPDTGADGWVLFEQPSRRLPPLTPLDTVGLRAFGRPRLLRRVLLERVSIGRLTLVDQVATLVHQTGGEMEADGLLPLHIFARVTFNARDGYLTVRPR